MIKYNYVVRTAYTIDDYGKIDVHKAITLADAYNFMVKYYLKEEAIKSQAEFYKKYPFEKVRESIENKGYFTFWDVLDIQTTEFYINDYISEVY